MLRAFLNIFSTKQVYPGEIYEFFDDDKSPFDNDPPHKVEVIAVKNGWVNYRWLNSRMFQNESLRLQSFRFCYMLANTACTRQGQAVEGEKVSE